MRLLALAALLVLGQLALAHHQVDLKKHTSGGHCEWCVAGNSLQAALGSSAWLPSADKLRHVYVTHAVNLIQLSFLAVYFGRAPPTFSRY